MSSTTTIAFYTDSPIFGGAEGSLGNLLSELDPVFDVVVAGVEPTVIERVAAYRETARTRMIPAVRGKWDVTGIATTFRLVRSIRSQIFQANLSVPSSGQYALAAAVTVRNMRTIVLEHLAYPLDGMLQLRLKRFTSRRLAAHVAVGDRVARDVEEFAGLGRGTILTIHNGVKDAELVPMPRPYEGPTLGTVGRLDRQKGYDILLHALTHVPDAVLILVGDGPERGPLEHLASELGIADRVLFEGWRDDARRYLTIFDVFVLPSRFEGFPLVIIEAMLARLPVVATHVGSVEEAVVNDQTGVLIQPDDPDALAIALRRLVSDPERSRELGERGRRRALQFTSATTARAFETLYEEVLS